MAELTALLTAAQSPDAATRTAAEQRLAALQASSYAELLAGLSAELADGAKPEPRTLNTRQQAEQHS